ncbi:MAG: hypothetical protein QW270_04385 [Candidatus Bathyarchaeia archaeon]
METQKINAATILAIAFTGIIVSALAAGLLMAYERVPNYGYLKAVGVGVYWNEACTNNVTSIDWGFLSPGTPATREIWIKNTGNTRIKLNMTTESWNPIQAKNYITLSWNCEGQVLDATNSIKAVLTLSVSTQIDIDEFAFDIIITGIEYT